MIKTRTWVVGLGLMLAVLVGIIFFGYPQDSDATVAVISLGGVEIERIDLSQVDSPYTFEVEGDELHNLIAVEHGRICVQEADCPDQLCVHQGWLTDSPQPIVCLPNQLTITLDTDSTELALDVISK